MTYGNGTAISALNQYDNDRTRNSFNKLNVGYCSNILKKKECHQKLVYSQSQKTKPN